MDIHPVAAIIARVTYLLALGEALQTRRRDISIPVYLGDAMQLSVSGMMAGRELVIQVPAPDPAKGNRNGQREMLRFPEAVCRDPHLLDSVVERMRLGSENKQRPEAFGAAVKALGVAGADLEELIDTYRRYDDLRKADRNTIWSYVARNLSRPLYLSSEERRVDVLIGNPPWLPLRYMSDDLHMRFKDIAKGENIYVGARLATQNDLSALFFVRAVALYLKPGGNVANAEAAANHGKAGLTGWMDQAEKLWNNHARSEMKLVDRWNYHNELGNQFPIAAIRVLYAASGTIPCATVLRDPRAVIEHKLYWARANTVQEGLYLATILGSEAARAKVERLQSRGQWGARDFDKVMFTLPIPRFDAGTQLHTDLAAAGAEAETVAASVDLPDGIYFTTARSRVREALAVAGISQRIDALVARLLA